MCICKAFSVALDTESPGCPAIWVGTSRDQKNFTQENFGQIFSIVSKSLWRVFNKN